MYLAIAEEPVENAVVITSTLLIHTGPNIVFCDSVSTHTFIAMTFVDRIGLSVDDLGYDFVVLTPA